MDWRDWELFCEVVQHGGFSAAARVLGQRSGAAPLEKALVARRVHVGDHAHVLERAARRKLTSMSEYARQSILTRLRRDGEWIEPAAAASESEDKSA